MGGSKSQRLYDTKRGKNRYVIDSYSKFLGNYELLLITFTVLNFAIFKGLQNKCFVMNLKTCQESVSELQTFRLKRKFIHCLSYGERESSSVVQLGNMPWRELFKNMAPENNSCTHHT